MHPDGCEVGEPDDERTTAEDHEKLVARLEEAYREIHSLREERDSYALAVRDITKATDKKIDELRKERKSAWHERGMAREIARKLKVRADALAKTLEAEREADAARYVNTLGRGQGEHAEYRYIAAKEKTQEALEAYQAEV